MLMNLVYKCFVCKSPMYATPSHRGEMINEVLENEIVFATGQEEGLWIEVQNEWDDYIGWVLKSQLKSVDNMDSPYYSDLELEYFVKRWRFAPYFWGGRSLTGIDCSGLSQMYYRNFNLRIPRDASMQALSGESIDYKNLLPGDLVFFGENKINHVGIFYKENKVFHASESIGFADIQELQEEGLVNQQGKCTHLFKSARRFI